ncbi:right-handed parallel beta-helix repeat-containing protein [Bartonella sp. WD12.1]|uniref:right-handed parallel beta-helix repeat-containing protein n=1 Tax=Bartonella sp. WD12.1 TaxID=1933903 RepID=UPI0009994587|nr:right-handed parallel beta-helix repeat-containing protein [Bartonella sp. WD12.1]OPB30085.1 Right handed beta helix region [Bartonella sp. WD12.1]
MTLTDVEISKVGTGVQMLGGKKLTMERGEIKEFTTAGVSVGISVISAELKGTVITGKGSGTGVKVEDKGTSANLTLDGVTIESVEKGVEMNGTGALMISGKTEIQFTSDNGYGVYVGKKVTRADLRNVTVTGENKGVGVKVSGRGVSANLTLTNVTVSKVATGLYMMGGKSLTMTGGSIGFTRSYGVYVGGEMTAKLTKTVITGSGGGNGVYATEGTVELDGVTIAQVETGVDISGGKSLTMKDGTIKEFTTEGMSVGISVISATLTGTIITGKGGGTGVKVEDKATASLTLTDVKISKVATGVEMNGTGALMISGSSTIQFKGKYGVYVGEGAVWLDDTTLRNVAKGMTVENGGCSHKGSIIFGGEHGISLTTGYAFLGEVAIEGKGSGKGKEGIKVYEGMLDLCKNS